MSLAEICEIIQGGRHRLSGKDFVEKGYPAYGAGGLNGYLSEFEFDREAIILSAIGARCGKCFYVVGKWSSLANTQLILPDSRIADARFLWFQLNDENRWPRSGTGQPFIKPSDVKRHKVYLPPLDEQKRIAAILYRAHDLRRKRRQALEKLNTLPRAIFQEMFGDPVGNPKGWRQSPFSDLLESLRNGISPSSDGKITLDVLTLSSVTGYAFDAQAMKPGLFLSEPPQSQRVYATDLLICRGNGNINLVGKGYFPLRDMPFVAFPDTIIAARVKTEMVEPSFLELLWNSPSIRHQIQRRARTTNGTHKINQTAVESISLPIPPLPLQLVFAEQTSAIESLRSKYIKSLKRCDQICASLQHHAFAGTLSSFPIEAMLASA